MKWGDFHIREIKEQDLELILEWRNSERVHSMMLTEHKITKEEHLKWFYNLQKKNPVINFMFCYKDKPIGYMGYSDVNLAEKSCSPGAYLGVLKEIPKDSGLYLTYINLEYAFAKLNMNLMRSEVFQDNKRAIKIDKIFGCRNTDIVNVYHKGGVIRKTTTMEITIDEWNKNKNKIKILLSID